MQILELYTDDYRRQVTSLTLNDVKGMLNMDYADIFKLSKENKKLFYKNFFL